MHCDCGTRAQLSARAHARSLGATSDQSRLTVGGGGGGEPSAILCSPPPPPLTWPPTQVSATHDDNDYDVAGEPGERTKALRRAEPFRSPFARVFYLSPSFGLL